MNLNFFVIWLWIPWFYFCYIIEYNSPEFTDTMHLFIVLWFYTIVISLHYIVISFHYTLLLCDIVNCWDSCIGKPINYKWSYIFEKYPLSNDQYEHKYRVYNQVFMERVLKQFPKKPQNYQEIDYDEGCINQKIY